MPWAARTIRILAFVLGALWFFPVSCTSGLAIGTSILSTLDTRRMDRGDSPHEFFYLVWLPGEEGAPFGHGFLRLQQNPAPEGRSYRMDAEWGELSTGGVSTVSFRRLAIDDASQSIEVEYFDGDVRSTSRYRVTSSGVEPLYSRVTQPGYMYSALPYAFAFAAVLYGIGLWLRRRVRTVGPSAAPSQG